MAGRTVTLMFSRNSNRFEPQNFYEARLYTSFWFIWILSFQGKTWDVSTIQQYAINMHGTRQWISPEGNKLDWFLPLGITVFFSSNGLWKWICKLQPNRKNNCTPEAVDRSEFTPESHDGWKMIEFRSLKSWPIFGGELINFQGVTWRIIPGLVSDSKPWLVSPLSTATA